MFPQHDPARQPWIKALPMKRRLPLLLACLAYILLSLLWITASDWLLISLVDSADLKA
ncbi:hypothetical protein AvCA_49050 [Azotobacter vinelandii CA]|uniref:Uncharacterized protein n=2 Tax=Azotobacter vinelandii TaxID=354 RepID=C1DK99_AZOVD|nr:hypothetical protein [Azotobacter vinelandii]ACO81004.1 hypothetical protein Avin_49050 [Azotobacter vinelandii DJ]AGK14210.1 hypothetical protein AvCA_49050 [Azotobacter vinelandii CA]AGK22285.1 hypothetical protein AvCA6_49050 [Azotobacter vinelandii CA6]GLK60520.1 hypothetical protein GCM10017624_26820 [Azotobacter vinelandii]